MVGRTVLHYQLLDKLGAGGMGEIFKAQDTRLNRFVAIKVLTTQGATADSERRRRFIQEAQAASALNHPNIITIHDIVSDGDAEHMVMEYVNGKTLVDLIPKGGLRAAQVLKYAVQMADALNAAHSAGIIHRDLKPGNVMVTESGLVKILDFGLAKLTDRGPLSQMGEDTNDQTRTIANAPLTVEGSIIGTVSYMSPEQAQGKKVDTRSDIFSFGVVLYEMTTGVRAFPGDSALSTLSAILRDDVRPLEEAAPEAPHQLDMVIQRCLRKNPDERWQTMKDVQMALAALKHESDSGMLYRARLSDSTASGVQAPRKGEDSTTTIAGPALSEIQAKAAATAGAKKSSSMPIIAAAVGVVVLAGAGIGGWLYVRHKRVVEAEAAAAAAAAIPPPPVVIAPPPPPPEATTPTPPAEAVLTNDSVIDMVKNKLPATLILSQLRNEKTDFVLTSAEVIRMTKAGVPESVIEGMRNPKKIPSQPVAAVIAPPTQQQPPQNKQTTPTNPPPTSPQTSPQPVAATPTPAPPPVVVTPTPPVTRAGAAVTAVVPDAKPITIILSADIPSTVDEGTPLRFTVKEDVKVGDQLVIAKGAPVTGAIVESTKKKFLGMGQRLTLRIDQTESTGGQKVALRALPVKRSEGTVRNVDTGKSKPKDMAAGAGTEYVAYTDGEQKVNVRK